MKLLILTTKTYTISTIEADVPKFDESRRQVHKMTLVLTICTGEKEKALQAILPVGLNICIAQVTTHPQ